ncbi:MAG: polysaccharide biosynthesis C-terminal domain-containing protein [Ferruginibacter sp.]
MSKNSSLTKLTSLYILGNLTSKIVNFGLFFLYTFYLSMSDLGFFDLIITSITLIAPIVSLQVYDAVLRWLINEKERININRVVSNSVIIMLISLAIFSFFYFIVWYFVDLRYGILIYVLLVLQPCYLLIPQIARGIGKSAVYALNGVVYSFSFLITASLFLGILKWKIEGLLIANILAILISLIFIFYKTSLLTYFKLSYFDKSLCRELINYSIPLIPNTLSWWVIAASNRYFILYFYGTALNGLFAIALKLPTIVVMISGIFTMAWIEKSIQVYNSDTRDEYYTSVFEKFFSLLFCAIIFLISSTKPLLKLIVQSSYYEVWKLLPFLYLAVGFQALSSFYGTGYLNSKRTKEALYTTIYGAGVTVISGLMLIPFAGLIGASISILLGYLVMFGVRAVKTREYFRIKLPIEKMIAINIILIITSLITISDNIVILACNVIFSLLTFIFFNKKFLADYLKKMLGKKANAFLEIFYSKMGSVKFPFTSAVKGRGKVNSW